MPSSNSCFGRQEDILNIVEFGRRNTTSILKMYVWSRQEGKVGLIVGFHSRVENGKWFSGMCFLSFWRKQTTSTDCLHHFWERKQDDSDHNCLPSFVLMKDIKFVDKGTMVNKKRRCLYTRLRLAHLWYSLLSHGQVSWEVWTPF